VWCGFAGWCGDGFAGWCGDGFAGWCGDGVAVLVGVDDDVGERRL
jgi:hypothetical protein